MPLICSISLKNETIENLILVGSPKRSWFLMFIGLLSPFNKSSKFPDELNRWPVQSLFSHLILLNSKNIFKH